MSLKKIALVGVILSNVAYANIAIDGWYANAFGGYAYIPNDLDNYFGSFYINNANYNSGYTLGARLGYKSNPLRYEGEFSYISAQMKYFKVNNIMPADKTGLTNVFAAMANVYYDFPGLTPSIEPYLGIGLGFANVNTHFETKDVGMYLDINKSNTQFAYQGTIGLMYNFAENFSLDAGYRYIRTTHIDTLGQSFQAHLITGGVTYRFDDAVFK
jgi:opacity protein-like surface antigen